MGSSAQTRTCTRLLALKTERTEAVPAPHSPGAPAAPPRTVLAHADRPHGYVWHTCTHTRNFEVWSGPERRVTCPGKAAQRGHSQRPRQLLVPAQPFLCPAWQGHPSKESPHRTQRFPLLCPHRHLPPSHRLAAPWGHAPPLGTGQLWSCICPGGGFVKSCLKLQGKAALQWVQRGFCCPTPDLWHHREGDCRGSGKAQYGTKRSCLLLHHPAEHGGLVTGMAAEVQGRYCLSTPAARAGSAALHRQAAARGHLYKMRFSVMLDIPSRWSLSTQISNLRNKSAVEALGYAGTMADFIPLSTCSSGFLLLRCSKVLVISCRAGHYASPHKCRSIKAIYWKILHNYWIEEYLNKCAFTVTSPLGELQECSSNIFNGKWKLCCSNNFQKIFLFLFVCFRIVATLTH